MKRTRMFLLSTCLVVIFTLLLPMANALAIGWVVVPSQNPGPLNNLKGVAWNRATNVQWAVGYFQKPGGFPFTLTETWNGAFWQMHPSPNQGKGGALNGVAAVIGSPAFWAVGYWINAANVKQTLTELWNGAAWVIVPSPNIGGGDNVLNGVDWDQTTKTAWAVGYWTNAAGTRQTLIERLAGGVWVISPSPNRPPGNNVLNGVAVDETTGQAQAVGYWTDAGGVTHTLAEQWFGVWKIIPSMNKGIKNNVLNGVAWIPNTHTFWAVGYFTVPVMQQTLVELWNGAAWVIVPSPNIGISSNALNGVAAAPIAAGPGTAWAVGYWTNAAGVLQTLTERWNGAAWVIVPSPNVGLQSNALNAVCYHTFNWNAVTVGYSGNNTLVEQF